MSSDATGSRKEVFANHAKPIYFMYPGEPDDGADLFDVVASLWSQKWLVIGIAMVFCFVGIVAALLETPIFRAEVVLAPAKHEQPSLASRLGGLAGLAGINLGGSGDSMEALATLRSREFAEEFIRDRNLLPVLFADKWDAAHGQWMVDRPELAPDLRDGVRLFQDAVFSVREDTTTPLVTVGIEWTDPSQAAEWVSDLVSRLNEKQRSRDLESSRRRLDYLNSQLATSQFVELRQAISALIQDQIQTIMLAQAEPEYAFRVIDPARIPKERIRPKRTLMVIIATLCGGLVGVLVGLIKYFLATRSRLRAANLP